MVGCEMRSPSDDVNRTKVLTYWYRRPLTIMFHTEFEASECSMSVTQEVNT